MKANLIMQYCTMCKKESSLDLYLRYKSDQAKYKKATQLKNNGGLIKKELYERHYLHQVEGVNTNIVSKIEKINKSSRDKVEKYLAKKLVDNVSFHNHLC